MPEAVECRYWRRTHRALRARDDFETVAVSGLTDEATSTSVVG